MYQPDQSTFQIQDTLDRFEEGLVAEGLISEDQLAIAKISTENLDLDLGSVLIKKKFVTEEQLLTFLAKKLGIEFLSLKDYQLNPELAHRIPIHIAKQHGAIPLHLKEENKISIAMADPFNKFALDDLKDILKCELEPCLASATEISEALTRIYERGSFEDKELTIEVFSPNDSDNQAETRKMQEMALGPKVVSIVNNMIAQAAADGASDIHIEPTRHHVRVRYRIDGMLCEKGELAHRIAHLEERVFRQYLTPIKF